MDLRNQPNSPKERKAMRASTFEFSDDLHKAIRLQCAEEDIKLKELVSRALRDYLDRVHQDNG